MQNIQVCIDVYKYIKEAWDQFMPQKKITQPRFWLMVMLVMSVAFLIAYVSEERTMASQQLQIQELTQQYEAASIEYAVLERKIAFAKTDDYVERTARNELGLLMPGEVRFVSGGDSSVNTINAANIIGG